jgi:NADPH:quinone reductase-like Zn-dependent oxidoreductase
MAWQYVRIARFGGPEVLKLAEQPTIPHPGPGEVRIKVLAAGTGFTDTFIRRGRYPDFKGPLPFTPGYDLVGVVEETGPGVPAQFTGQLVADICVVGILDRGKTAKQIGSLWSKYRLELIATNRVACDETMAWTV